MKKIARSAYFALCPDCRRHGHIICIDKTVSHEFATIAGGLKEMMVLVLSGKIAEDEALEPTRQIRESGFAQEAPEVDEILVRRSETKEGALPFFKEAHREAQGTKNVSVQMDGEKKSGRRLRRTLQ